MSDAWIFNEVGRVWSRQVVATVEDMLDYEIVAAKAATRPLKCRSSVRSWSAAAGADQVYYKYKTDFWREAVGSHAVGKFEFKSQHWSRSGTTAPCSGAGESPSPSRALQGIPLVMSTATAAFYFLGQYRNIRGCVASWSSHCQLHRRRPSFTASRTATSSGSNRRGAGAAEAAYLPASRRASSWLRPTASTRRAGRGISRRVHLEPNVLTAMIISTHVRSPTHVPHLQGVQARTRN